MTLPTQIIDLHTHVFNARFLPLAGIIADLVGNKDSVVAGLVARLINLVTASSVEAAIGDMPKSLAASPQDDEAYIDHIWRVTQFEIESLLKTSLATPEVELTLAPMSNLKGMNELELVDVINQLAELGLDEDIVGMGFSGGESIKNLSLFTWQQKAETAVKRALRFIRKVSAPDIIEGAENILHFIFLMLREEKDIAREIFNTYGEDLGPIRIVHYMMDMEHAYARKEPAYYSYPNEQFGRMDDLRRAFPGRVIGFAAFDPRRPDAMAIVEKALRMGFKGFKFYPAMGYRPNDTDPVIKQRIKEFFDFCVANDVPIFTHCTPQGFQTKAKLGWNAHPLNWKAVLDDPQNPHWKNLRLCLGHAGGGDLTNVDKRSYGWQCSAAQWNDPAIENFARNVVDLCINYKNVYCEMANHAWLFENDGNLQTFKENFRQQLKMSAAYKFEDKVAYGSDWHMPSMVLNVRRYLLLFLRIVDEQQDVAFLEKFFWKNASQYLKLPLE